MAPIESGGWTPNEHLALISSALFPVSLLSQLWISATYFADKGGAGSGSEGTKALSLWIGCYPARLLLGGLGLIVVLIMPYYAGGPDGLPASMYFVMVVLSACGAVANGAMFVAQMAFYNRVSDPAIGGTYMTMLNTISNVGSAWPATAALWVVGQTTVKSCKVRPDCKVSFFTSSASTAPGSPQCGDCEDLVKEVNGFVVTVVISLVIGTLWYLRFRKRVIELQSLPASAWLATAKP